MCRRKLPTRHPATLAVVLLLALAAGGAGTHLALAQDPGTLRHHIDRQKGRERQLASAAARLGRLEQATAHAVDVMAGRLTEAQGDLAAWQARLAKTQQELRVTRQRLVRLRARLAESRRALATMLRQRYTADQPDVVTVVLDAKGFADVLERIEFLRRVQHSDTMIVDAVRRGRNDARHDERILAALEPRQREQTAAVRSQRDALARMTAALQSAARGADSGPRGPSGGAEQHAGVAPARAARALAAARRAGAGRGQPWPRRAVGDPVADRRVRVGRAEPAAQRRHRVGLLPDARQHLARARRQHAARLSGLEGRAGPPCRPAVGGRGGRAQLGVRRAGRHLSGSTSGRASLYAPSLLRARRAADHLTMDDVMRLIDGDPASLEARVARLLERVGADWRVARFTYWYTGRPPIHEALLVRPPVSSGG